MSETHPVVRISLLVLGWNLIIISPIIGALPGPGFIIIFPIGLVLVLRNSNRSKRLYVKIAQRFPDYGRWVDWAMRRKRQPEAPQLPPLGKRIRRYWNGRKS